MKTKIIGTQEAHCRGQSGVDNQPLVNAIEALRVLAARRFELAGVLGMALRSVNELMKDHRLLCRREKRLVCVNALRTLRAAKKRCWDWDRPQESIYDDAVFLLLRRVIDDLDRLVGCILKTNLGNASEREDLQETIAQAVLSVLAAETYCGREQSGESR